jgi:hypothetical protein
VWIEGDGDDRAERRSAREQRLVPQMHAIEVPEAGCTAAKGARRLAE